MGEYGTDGHRHIWRAHGDKGAKACSYCDVPYERRYTMAEIEAALLVSLRAHHEDGSFEEGRAHQAWLEDFRTALTKGGGK